MEKIYVESQTQKRNRAMDELSKREFLVLKEIHLTGETSDEQVARKFVDEKIIIDACGLLLTHKGRSLLVRGLPQLWDVAA
jgi:hypothetical protein